MVYTYENPSPEYKIALELGKQFQRENKTFTGRHCFQSFPLFKALIAKHNSRTLLDFGCGKGEQLTYKDIRLLDHKDRDEKTIYPSWQTALGVGEYYMYDPCVPQYEKLPTKKYDCTICTDVLEHITTQDMPWVLDQMFSLTNQWVYASIALFLGKKILADGSYAHKAQLSLEEWVKLWWETGRRYPHVEWHTRIEVDVPPITHRYFTGQGEEWEEGERFWKIWKPSQLEALTEKQRIEMEQAARAQRAPLDPRAFGKNRNS